jgi:hypothetical protein
MFHCARAFGAANIFSAGTASFANAGPSVCAAAPWRSPAAFRTPEIAGRRATSVSMKRKTAVKTFPPHGLSLLVALLATLALTAGAAIAGSF